MTTIALIVAAGRGARASGDSRDSGDRPKQYRDIAGAPVLRHTLRAFACHPAIDAVLPIIHPDDGGLFAEAAAGLSHIRPAVYGGATRQDSVRYGLESLDSANADIVLIHDGARPLVSAGLIGAVIEATSGDTAALPALPVGDTLRRAADGLAGEIMSRDNVVAAQTPQGFPYRAIRDAHRRAQASGRQFTDDVAVAQWAGMRSAIVDGQATNLKITQPDDFRVAEALLNAQTRKAMEQIRTGQGFDVHAFTTGSAVTICGVEIPHERSLAGHSDADVGLHALTDAVLGAIGAGDIGSHFPPGDPQWAGADSARFLTHAAALIRGRNGRVSHVDVTIICEAPKIGPHRAAMRERIAELLSLDIDRVSVKATTTEKLGFAGRGEGIAAQAVATVMLP